MEIVCLNCLLLLQYFSKMVTMALCNGRLSNYELCLFQLNSLNQLGDQLIISSGALPTSTL